VRGAFIRALAELAQTDDRILLITGDLGYLAIEPFSEKFPGRFFNAGVAEQNLIGVATGLADAGYLPFAYSIVTFATLRPYEFIRNGPILHHLPVRIVGIGGGFEYSHNGASHYGLEDVGVMRTQPGITIVAPADHEQTRSALLATWSLPGPVYYRLGKDDRTTVPGLEGAFELGKVATVYDGADLAIVATGAISVEAVAAAELLAQRGIHAAVFVVSSFNPSPDEDLAQALRRFPLALTVEAHYVVGGLGSFVAEVVAERQIRCRVVRCGVRCTPDGTTGSQDYLYRVHGISRLAVAQTALKALSCDEP
jgi:transketolase